mgnify:CR=1 FL=1
MYLVDLPTRTNVLMKNEAFQRDFSLPSKQFKLQPKKKGPE